MLGVPGIYWFVFWVAVATMMFVGLFWAGRLVHMRKMKALDILRMYAEKGIEPPEAMREILREDNAHAGDWPPPRPKRKGRRRHVEGINFSLFWGLAWGAIAWWRWSEGGEPQWLFLLAVIFCVLSIAGVLTGLLNLLFAPRD